MDRLITAVATGLYTGRIPFAPGTWGSAAALLPWYFCRTLTLPGYLAVLAAILVVGTLAAGAAEKILNQPDPGCVVIDEVLGVFVTLTLAPNHPAAWVLGFVLFRFFDILKPFPVSWLDTHVHGGLGIMLDDVMAGIYAFCCLQLSWLLIDRLA